VKPYAIAHEHGFTFGQLRDLLDQTERACKAAEPGAPEGAIAVRASVLENGRVMLESIWESR
jgi:hypothetical protein